jgi:hypothetical protein
METELSRLEQRLEQLIGLYESDRLESRNLRMRIVSLEAENRRLADKVRLATEKLESVLDRLPEL